MISKESESLACENVRPFLSFQINGSLFLIPISVMLSFLGTNGAILKTLGISETDKIKVPQILKERFIEDLTIQP